MCDTGVDLARCISEGFRKARKPHCCIACREIIPAGHRYHYGFYILDAEPEDYKHCLRCWSMFMEIYSASREPVALDLDCGEVWEDTIGELPERVASLAFMSPADAQKELD